MASNAVGGGAVDAEGFLKYLLHLHRVGYTRALNVTQRAAGANMSVDVNIDSDGYGGALFATASAVPYFGYTNAAINAAVTTADPTNPRKDIVVAYIDLSLITTGTTNNLGAFKVKVVAGTAAASPSDPSGASIQASVGAGNPYIQLARVSLTAALGSITNAVITDLRTPAANAMPYLWGGALNTVGHQVPNFADDTVALLNAAQTIKGKSISLTGNAATGNILTNPYKFRVYRSAAQSAAAGAFVKINFDTKTYDTSSNFDNATNFRFTAPVAGFYWFQARAGQANATNACVSLYKNGAEVSRGSQIDTAPISATTSGKYSAVSDVISLNAGDYVEAWLFSNNATAIDVSSVGCYFSGYLVSHL